MSKRIALAISISFIGLVAFSQTIKYEEISESTVWSTYTEYVLKNGTVLKAGDIIRLGEPKYEDGKYDCIRRGGKEAKWRRVPKTDINGTKVIIDRFITYNGIIWAEIKLSPPIHIDIEKALKSGEVAEIIKPDEYAENNNNQHDTVQITGIDTAIWVESSISFYENWDRIHKLKVTAIFTGIGGAGFAVGGAISQVREAAGKSPQDISKLHIPLYIVGGAFALTSFVCMIVEIAEIGKIRDKHQKIRFTGNGVVIKF